MASKMQAYRPVLGIGPDTAPGIEAFTADLIARLDRRPALPLPVGLHQFAQHAGGEMGEADTP